MRSKSNDVYDYIFGKIIISQTGKDLSLRSFEVPLNKEYNGGLFETSIHNQ